MYVLREEWDEKFKKLNPGEPILHIAHSHGVLITRNALMGYPEDLRNRIFVLAIAPGAYISNHLCAGVKHYVSYDFVPIYDSPGKAMAKSQGTYHWLVSDHGLPKDHSFKNSTYRSVISTNVKKFLLEGKL